MKKKFLNYSLNLLKKENKYDDGKIAELMYGLEAFYMISTKLIVVIAVAIYYNIFFGVCQSVLLCKICREGNYKCLK